MRFFTKALIVGFALGAACSVETSEPEWRFPSDQITVDQWSQFRSEVLAKPKLERQEFANQLVLISTIERRLWIFTQPGHPAYPAVVVRIVTVRGTGSEISRQGHYAGNKAAFDKWWHDFDVLDAKIPGQVRQ